MSGSSQSYDVNQERSQVAKYSHDFLGDIIISSREVSLIFGYVNLTFVNCYLISRLKAAILRL